MACKGDEPRLRENIEAVLAQEYPNYKTIIVTDTSRDPAYSVAETILNRHPDKDAQLYTADNHPKASGKVAAVLTGLEKDTLESEVYAFVDSDALTTQRWLRDITDPLGDQAVGATTGFRWYFPERGGLWSHVESAWNASGTNIMFNGRYNFPWGGAMAIRRDVIKAVNLQSVWETAISDDLSLNSALRSHGYRIVFVPQCMAITFNQATMANLLKWATRQIALTKSFNPTLWNYGRAAYGLLTVLDVLAIASLIAGFILSPLWFLPSLLLFTPLIFGVFRSNQRIQSFRRALPEFASRFEKIRWPHSIVGLIVPWIMTYCIFKSARTKEIEWRGRRYKLTTHAPK